MSLIEHLEYDNWQDVLRGDFEYTLEVLEKDRFRSVGSAVDDLRAWLASGGMSRVKEHLNNQMEIRRFSPTKKAAVNELLEQLARENRRRLLDLMAEGVLSATKQEVLSACGFSESSAAARR